MLARHAQSVGLDGLDPWPCLLLAKAAKNAILASGSMPRFQELIEEAGGGISLLKSRRCSWESR